MKPSRGHFGSWAFVLGVLLTAAWVFPPAAPRAEEAKERPYPHGEWQEDCSLCHRDDRWLPAEPAKGFDHSKYFKLDGAHRAVGCRACHVSLDFSRAKKSCVDCHQDVHRGEMGTDCARCHSPRSFIDRSQAVRTHRTTRFPLSGAHAAADCEACHRIQSLGRMMYVNLPVNCLDCHASTAFPAAPQRPPATHSTPPMSTEDCSSCHNTFTFGDVQGAHKTNGFPLTGGHAIACSMCHGDPFRSVTDRACYSCHRTNYEGTTDPNHLQAQFPADCSLCHNTTSWAGATFNHANTAFPLTGAHVGRPCSDCHADGVYRGKSTACVSCHQAAYNGTTDPNHVQAQFPTDCTLCHNTTSWAGATFDHANTAFPLTGAHVGLACSSCHADGVYRGKPTACYACHQAAYTGVTDPNHVAARFATDCRLCHNTTSFSGARYTQHDSADFPIYSGRHAGQWTHCSDCHTSSTDYATFSCFLCHAQADTTSRHSDVSGFRYDSAACYSCHPRGNAG